MKIGLLNNLYGPFKRGGAEKIVANMANDYRAAGHEVFLISAKPHGALVPETGSFKIYYLDSRYYNLADISFIQRLFWHLGDLFNFKKYRAIKKILRQEKPDLVVTHNLMGLGFLTPLLIRNLKINHQHFLHDIQILHPSGLMLYGREKEIDSLFARLYQSFTRHLFASPGKIISPSHWLLEQHKQRGFFKNSLCEIRPYSQPKQKNPISTTALNSTPKKNGRVFLYVGQIVEAKGIFLLIEAFKNLKKPDAKLFIVGNGLNLEKAKRLAAIDQRIIFFPWSEETETTELASCDYLIVPSLCYENSPTIIAKAHEMGQKVIASRLGGVPEITDQKDILFVPEIKELTKILELISITN